MYALRKSALWNHDDENGVLTDGSREADIFVLDLYYIFLYIYLGYRVLGNLTTNLPACMLQDRSSCL